MATGSQNLTSYQANKLTNERELYVDLSTTRDSNNKILFDGTADKILQISGILSTIHGGTGTNTDPDTWGIIYATSTTADNVTTYAYASTTAGTAGYLLQSNATSAPDWIQATDSNVVSTIVKRDSNGDFSAGIITADLSGNASSATILETAREIYTDLSNQRDTNNKITFDGSADIAIHVNGTLPVANGGTNNTSFTAGHIVYASSATQLSDTQFMHLNYLSGTATTDGYEELVIGNSTATGTVNNAYGLLTLYSTNTKGAYLRAASSTSWYTHTLPAATGWVATGGNGIDTGAGDSDTPVYLKTDGTLAAITSYDGNAATATTWQTARTLTIGATGKSVNGSGNVSWSMNEIMGSSDSTKFYRGDKTWSSRLTGGLDAAYIGVTNTTSTNGYGISLYNGATASAPTYGIMFQGTGTFGKHGAVTSDWATYFTMNDNTARGWIFRRGSTNVASISGGGTCTLDGGLEIKGHIAGDSGTTGHGLYSGGAYHNAYNNIILQGDGTTGSSGIAFVSSKGTATINQPSDRAFIQFHAYGVTTYTAENTAPTLATSGEANVLVIGVGNDATDTVRLQTPGRTGLLHQVAANAYVIPDTNNTTGSVGGTTTPVYVDGGVIKTCTAYASASVNYATSSGSCTGNAATATALTSNAGGTEQPIYFTGGKPSATSYALKATVNNSTAGYFAYYSAARAISGTSNARLTDGCLNLYPSSGSYREGIRIYPTGSWATIVLGGNDLSATSGTSANSWSIHNNNGTFYINKNASSSAGNPRVYANANGWYFTKAYGAVWNDYAEYRQANTTEPGRVIIPSKDGIAHLSTERLQSGGRIISDTYGFAVGESDKAKTPVGLSGRVLAYPYQNIENYQIGDAVCTAPNGTVDIMTREEIIRYPERIIGIVNEIPSYEFWESSLECPGGEPTTTQIKVNGRIWIDIK